MTTARMERAEAAELPEDDLIGVLLSQHARIRDLFPAVQSAQGEERRRRFDELRGLLAVHETAEEMILRPVAKKAAGAGEAEARNEEEAEADKVLSRLEKTDLGSAEFDRMLADFEKSVSAHADHEEKDEFPAIRRDCSEDDLRTLGRRLLAVEKTAPTRPHPGTAGSPAAQWTVGPFASLVDHAKDALGKASGRQD